METKSVNCNYCGWEGKNFWPLEGKLYTRLNAKCPVCGSLERHRSLLFFLKEKMNFFSNPKNVLEISPFSPIDIFHKICKKSNISYLSIDIDPKRAMIQCDITKIPLLDEKFDVIICYHVLEHVKTDIEALKELYRILKKDGYAIIQVPIECEKTIEYDKPDESKWDHVRAYGKDFKLRLQSVGFNVKIDKFLYSLDLKIIKKYRLKIEDIYVSTKKCV